MLGLVLVVVVAVQRVLVTVVQVVDVVLVHNGSVTALSNIAGSVSPDAP